MQGNGPRVHSSSSNHTTLTTHTIHTYTGICLTNMSKGRGNTILNRIMEYKYRTYSSIIFGEKNPIYSTWPGCTST